MQTPLNPNLTQASLESFLIFWPGESAVGPPHCHSYGVVSCGWDKDTILWIQDRVNINGTLKHSVKKIVWGRRARPKNAEDKK